MHLASGFFFQLLNASMNNFVSLLVLTLSSVSLLASSGGQTGRTAVTSGGCSGGGCHAGSPSTNTSVSILEAVDDRLTVEVGATVQLTVVVAHASRASAGMNVAVKTTETGPDSAGTFATITGQGTRISFGELTHSNPKPMTGGQASFAFMWTAPTAEGEYFIRAIGIAVNRDGAASGTDQWAYMTPVIVTVRAPNSVSEQVTLLQHTLMPVPAHESVSMSVPTVPGEALDISVMNLQGIVMTSSKQIANDNELRFTWNGLSREGSPVPSGPYIITMRTASKIARGRALILR